MTEKVGEGEDIAWREFNIYDGKGKDDATDAEEEEEEENNNQEFMFQLFDKKDDEEITEYNFPGLPEISLRGKSEYTNSTGLQVWLGSEVLCDYLLSHSKLVNQKSVLELGAGLGLCGLVSHHLGASKVLMTDGDTNVLDTLRYNVQQNTTTESSLDKTISCPQLIWGRNIETFQKQHRATFDVILATDCIYMPQSLEPLWETIHQLLTRPDGLFLYVNLCTSQAPIEQILEMADRYNFVWTRHESSKTGNEDVYIFRQQPKEYNIK